MFVHGAANPSQSFHDSPWVATIFSTISADLQLNGIEALVEADLKLAKVNATVMITNKSADLLARALSLHLKVIPVIVLFQAARSLPCLAWATTTTEGLVLAASFSLFMLVLASISFPFEVVVDVGGLLDPLLFTLLSSVIEMSTPVAAVLVL